MEQPSTEYPNPCIPLLPSEIIELILLRLPAKPLGRFKSVSKTWNSIISDPRFIKTHTLTHLTHTPKKLIALSTNTESFCSIELTVDNTHSDAVPAIATKLNFIPPTKRLRWEEVFGSCNGLVLAGAVNGRVYLMNPTTGRLWKLPKNPFEPEYLNAMGKYDIRYGFSYDSSTDDYKVVSICFFSRTAVSVDSVSIYSVRNDCWKKLLTNAVPRAQPSNYSSCALVDDKCHWLTRSPSIIAFSFKNELFTEICLPDSLQGWSDVVEIGGKLDVYSSIRDATELWVMHDYCDAKSWTRVYSHGDGWMMPVCLVEGSDQDIVLRNRYRDGVVVPVFNIDEKKCRIVRIIGGPSEFIRIVGTFVESIESIERISMMTQRVKVMDN